MPVERSAGIIIFRNAPEGRKYLVLRASRSESEIAKEKFVKEFWDFAKGRLEPGVEGGLRLRGRKCESPFRRRRCTSRATSRPSDILISSKRHRWVGQGLLRTPSAKARLQAPELRSRLLKVAISASTTVSRGRRSRRWPVGWVLCVLSLFSTRILFLM